MSDRKPRYVEGKAGAGGTTRWYWRPKDEPDMPLGDDRPTAWLRAEELNAQRDARRAGLAGPPKLTGTVKWLVQSYLASARFREKADKTKVGYRRYATWMIEAWGDAPCSSITVRLVQAHKDSGTATPWETNAQLRFVSLVFEWARKQGMVASNPAVRFGVLKTQPRRLMWEPAEIAAFLKDATASIRVAVALGLYTLQREGDLIRLPWSAVAKGRFELRQNKTGKLVGAELHGVLQAVLDATPRQHVQVLVSEMSGRPYRETEFQHVFAYDRGRLGVRRELQFRDLRRTGAVTLARLGVPIQKIAALGGWEIGATTEILKTYIPLDEHMASSAIQAWTASGG